MATKLGRTKKLTRTWIGPYRVIRDEGPVTYRIRRVGTRQKQVVHVNWLKPYHGKAEEELPEDSSHGRNKKKQREEETEEEGEKNLKENPAVIPQGILIERETEKSVDTKSGEEESEEETDEESEKEFLDYHHGRQLKSHYLKSQIVVEIRFC
ncbi:hypothetical protein JTB14_007278 [Gonioctena quinquepunctata]|nr:hypothetical protein JTB14_007278 [Gonioctena quinquepunctata]